MGDPWTRKEVIGDCTLYLGDCLEVMPALGKVDAVVTDPPYGMDWSGKVTRGKNGTGKKGKTRSYDKRILNDAEPFDPSFLLSVGSEQIIFGFNHYPDKLQKGSALVWVKRYDEGFGSFLSDAEIAYFSSGHGVYCFRDLSKQGDSKNIMHPTQKPIPLMKWCIEKLSGNAETILDPFMGSGTTLVACAKLGRKGIGIELDPDYFEIACKRVQAAYDQPDLFVAPPTAPTQEGMDL
jgi:site-specific DNA-methyltransferase (adenine-specific)